MKALIIIAALIAVFVLVALLNRNQTHHLITSIDVDAPASVVWEVLTNTDDYAWNPFVKSVEGELAEGNVVNVTLSDGMRFTPTVLVAEPNRELRWLGRLGLPRVIDGEHIYRIVATSDSTVTFEHNEDFTGFLVPLLRSKLDEETVPGFESMNRALKETAERVYLSARTN
ncbi:MAG: SRPBCC domain-containing protein [Rhodothermales bacterium]|nr:SRPBCC domain-containing protein [Rhodothermales bacterium]